MTELAKSSRGSHAPRAEGETKLLKKTFRSIHVDETPNACFNTTYQTYELAGDASTTKGGPTFISYASVNDGAEFVPKTTKDRCTWYRYYHSYWDASTKSRRWSSSRVAYFWPDSFEPAVGSPSSRWHAMRSRSNSSLGR
eukprot:Rmarinus@m.27059